MKQSKETKREEWSPPLYGDILYSIVKHVPTIDLLPASRVSSTWRLAVSSTLRRFPRRAPWLILHLHSPLLRRLRRPTTLAYDPHSRSWAPLPPPSLPHDPLTCPLRSSLPGLLFSLSFSRLSVSSHPLAATWLHLPPPSVSRSDPVVALVGDRLVVAGGAYEFEDLPLAVEVLDLSSRSPAWTDCEPLPDEFRHSASATWLSVATSDKSLFVLDKNSGLFASFDPESGKWSRTCQLKPDPKTRLSAITFSDGRLILAGVSGSGPDLMKLTLWEVDLDLDSHSDSDSDLRDPETRYREIGSMPREMVELLAGSGFGWTTIGFGVVGAFGYFYNPGDFRGGAVLCEFERGRWERIERPKEVDQDPTARIVFGCSRVRLGDLEAAFGV